MDSEGVESESHFSHHVADDEHQLGIRNQLDMDRQFVLDIQLEGMHTAVESETETDGVTSLLDEPTEVSPADNINLEEEVSTSAEVPVETGRREIHLENAAPVLEEEQRKEKDGHLSHGVSPTSVSGASGMDLPAQDPAIITNELSDVRTNHENGEQQAAREQPENGQQSDALEVGLATAEQSFQHVELHIVDTDDEAKTLRAVLLNNPDQNVHLLACAHELNIEGIVPTQMDAMAGATPLFTYVLSNEFMGAAQEIAKSLMAGVDANDTTPRENGESKKTSEPKARRGRKPKAIVEPELDSSKADVYDFEDVDATAKQMSRRVKRRAAKRTVPEPTDEEENDEEECEETEPPKKRARSSSRKSLVPAMKCLYCDYTTSKKYLLIRHMRCHSDERPHRCEHPGCDRAFKTTASMQNHSNTHCGVKPHSCRYEGCSASFTTSGELVRHVRYKHTHEKPHKCHYEGCGYDSVELSKLKRHLRSHTGERPYKCEHCDYASPDTYKLKRHLRVHTGEKPYECDICKQRFTQSNSMKAHRLIHSPTKAKFQCQLCPTKCSRKTDLKIHVQKLHQSDEPINCKKCQKSFADRYLFNVHKRTSATCFPGRGQKKKDAEKASENEEKVTLSVTVQEETQPEAGSETRTMRCILPDGDIVHIVAHNPNDDGSQKFINLTAAQLAALKKVGEESTESSGSRKESFGEDIYVMKILKDAGSKDGHSSSSATDTVSHLSNTSFLQVEALPEPEIV